MSRKKKNIIIEQIPTILESKLRKKAIIQEEGNTLYEEMKFWKKKYENQVNELLHATGRDPYKDDVKIEDDTVTFIKKKTI